MDASHTGGGEKLTLNVSTIGVDFRGLQGIPRESIYGKMLQGRFPWRTFFNPISLFFVPLGELLSKLKPPG